MVLCGGCFFDGLNVCFVVNLVNNFWDDEIGDIIIVYVKDFIGNVIVLNFIGSDNKFLFDFNFMYILK